MRPNKIFTLNFPILQEASSQQSTVIHRRSKENPKNSAYLRLSSSPPGHKQSLEQRFKAMEKSLKDFQKYQLYSSNLVVRVARAKTETLQQSALLLPRSNSAASSTFKTTYQSFNDRVPLCRHYVRPGSNSTSKAIWRRLVPPSLPQPTNKLKIIGKNLQVI